MKKKRWKQCFIAIIAVLLTACGKDTKEASNTNARSEYCYQPTYQSLKLNIDDMRSVCKKDDRIYMYGTTWEKSKGKNM